MPRSRGSEMPQRPSPRGLAQLRTSTTSNSALLHDRPITDRSSKLGDRRSPRSAQSDPLSQKKFGSRIAGLESQLGQAQEELKILKEQLASVEAAKKDAQNQLERKTQNTLKVQGKQHLATGVQELSKRKDSSTLPEIPANNQRETDVFEVPVEPNVELGQPDQETKPISSLSTESPEPPQKLAFNELALKNDEINSLKAKLEEKEREMGVSRQENESLKRQLNEAASERSSSRAKEEEMSLKLSQLGQQLEASRATEVELRETVEAVERAKEVLETEMKKLRVQTEQWRKAADAAAAVLAGGVEMNNGRRISERYGSMDKHIGNIFEPSVGGGGYMGLGGGDDLDDGKRKGSGIRMLGDLWKKKGQK